jgi:hypothetical protein
MITMSGKYQKLSTVDFQESKKSDDPIEGAGRSGVSPSAELEHLTGLWKDGLLTDPEFETAKEALYRARHRHRNGCPE